jgi:N-acetylglucosaminyl-diphospho-decaprenol L-rhamnosyltransferase
MSQVGIVVVTHNSGKFVGACLDAALRTESDVVVVDNASTDGTIEEVGRRPSVRLIRNAENRGFAAGVNRGFAALGAPLLLLLNPDAVLLTGLSELVAACAQPGAGASAGRLVGDDGATQVGFALRRFPTPLALALETLGVNRLWPGNPVNRRYRCLDVDHNQAAEVEQPAGALLMIRRDTWEQLGGLDEAFFPAWFEDVDFCRRMADAGLRILYVPGVVARHVGGHSFRQISWAARKAAWYLNLMRYAGKHFGPGGAIWIRTAVAVACLLRAIPEALAARRLDPIAVYARIAAHALTAPLRPRDRGSRTRQ